MYKRQVQSVHGSFDEKIAIIGGGPAGLSAAYYLAQMGYKPTVFEKTPIPGGMMTYGIPSYKLEKDGIAAEIDIIKALGAEIKCVVEVGKDITIDAVSYTHLCIKRAYVVAARDITLAAVAHCTDSVSYTQLTNIAVNSTDIKYVKVTAG